MMIWNTFYKYHGTEGNWRSYYVTDGDVQAYSIRCVITMHAKPVQEFVINIQAYIVVFECTVVMFCLMLL